MQLIICEKPSLAKNVKEAVSKREAVIMRLLLWDEYCRIKQSREDNFMKETINYVGHFTIYDCKGA